jgi:hypothetical protein
LFERLWALSDRSPCQRQLNWISICLLKTMFPCILRVFCRISWLCCGLIGCYFGNMQHCQCLLFLCGCFLCIIRFVLVIWYVMHRNICLRFSVVNTNIYFMLYFRVHLKKSCVSTYFRNFYINFTMISPPAKHVHIY